MRIRFYANLRSITDKSILDITNENIETLGQLLEHLIDLFPEIGPQIFNEKGDLRQDVPVFVNGRNPRLVNAGLDIIIQEDDEITIFSPISSGRMNVEVMRSPRNDDQE